MPEEHTRLLADRYELTAPVGRGTMGTVWRAWDRSLGREVAVKQIRQEPGLTPEQQNELRERMIREGRIAARFNHPSVATVHDAIVVDGSPWIIMELVEGRSLEQIIEEEGPLPPRLVAEIGCDLLSALRAAHAQGILHRDVKPSNVLLTDTGRVVLTDFGIAKGVGDTDLTKTGMVIGSPGYTAPERARGDYSGPESDLWSLGATLYFAVEGRPAYERGSVAATLAALMTETADPPTQAGPLRPILDGLLEKDHTLRLSAETAAAMLRAVADGKAPDLSATARPVHYGDRRPEPPAPGGEPRSRGAFDTGPKVVGAAAAFGGAGPERQPGPRDERPGGQGRPAAAAEEDAGDRTVFVARPKSGGRYAPNPPGGAPGAPGGYPPGGAFGTPPGGGQPWPGQPQPGRPPQPWQQGQQGQPGQQHGQGHFGQQQQQQPGWPMPPSAFGPSQGQEQPAGGHFGAAAPQQPARPAEPTPRPPYGAGPGPEQPGQGYGPQHQPGRMEAAAGAPAQGPAKPLPDDQATAVHRSPAQPGPQPQPAPGQPGPGQPGPGQQGPGQFGPAAPYPGQPAQPGAPGGGQSAPPPDFDPPGLGTEIFELSGLGGEQQKRPARVESRTGMFLLVGIALAGLAVIVILVASALSGSGDAKPTGSSSTISSSQDDRTAAAGTPSAEPTATAAAKDPDAADTTMVMATEQATPVPTGSGDAAAAGLRRHVDDDFQIDVPAAVTGGGKDGKAAFTTADKSRRITVDALGKARADILTAAREAERAALDDRRHPDYRLVKLELVTPPPYPGTDVVDWEYTYTQDGKTRHVLSRWVTVPGARSYVINWTAPHDSWQQDAAERTRVLDSFTPARPSVGGS